MTTTTTSTTTTAAPPPVVVLTATVVEPFVEELTNSSSPEFQTLAAKVVAVYDVIYSAKYGVIFIRSFVIEFRPAVARTRMENTEAEVGIEFNQTASAAEIPEATDVAQTLVESVSNPNNTFNLTVEADSIQIIQRNNTSNSTTAPPTLNTTITTAAAATTTKATTKMTSITTTTVTTPTTTSTTTTAEAITTRRMTFRSAGETFTSDLSNPSSAAFQSRASMIKSELEPFYQNTFSSFRSLTVISFSNGSIINNIDLGFASTSVPNNTQIANVLVNAASNISAFNIDTTSISVDGAEVSSGVSHKTSLITASCLVLLSWLLSSQQ
ncbi:transcription initiation factor TFIID subunit 12-like isoform X2 [Thunnus albacares]|uniref:transcription initiation factor TFIID subunit 12-like isoform X2 n=1 Tax=Thunnus albacares TaxID=8236 RepID=UPI001CF62AA2|nr:transcription initiation factor TFIID subunit 12-like isoform X2 [Thunnus albacares]